MRAHRAVLILLICFLSLVAVAAGERVFTLAQYKIELTHLGFLAGEVGENGSAADSAIAELRGDWKIESDGQTFALHTGWLIDRFEKLKDNNDPQVREQLQQQLQLLRDEAEAYGKTPPDSTAAHARLTQILARHEFHNVQGPTWWDRLKYRILMWIFRVLDRFFGNSAAPAVGRVLVWTLVTIAVLVVAYFVFRAVKQGARFESVIPQVLPVSAKGWHIWMQEAQAAATKGNWREAVHLAYWAGISFLEQSGMWKPDQARTPREYLRLLPAESNVRSTLSALTRRLEETWYGNQQARPETFTEVSKLLESLGCHQA